MNSKRVLDELNALRVASLEELCAINGNVSVDYMATITEYPEQAIESIDTYIAQIETFDPEYTSVQLSVDAAKRDVLISKMGWLPEFSLGYNYTNEMGTKFNGVLVGVSVPVFSNKNKVSAAKSEQISAEIAQKDILITKEKSFKAIYAHIVTLKSQIHSYKNVLENGTNQAMLKKALNGGQLSLLDYLLELRYFLEAEQSLLDLEFEYNTQLTDLNKYNLL